MGLPNISITFQTLANSAIQRTSKGVVGIILRDAALNGPHTITRQSGITDLETLGVKNQKYISRALLGYVNQPQKVVVYVLPADAEDYAEALSYFATQQVDYLVGPPDLADTSEIITWINDQRAAKRTPKAVLPDAAADNYAIVNFTSDGIKTADGEYTTAEYCSRIAGLIAGTPMTMSCTYAPLTEVQNISPTLTPEEMDAAIDAGKFIIFNDGRKVKVGRGVNSYTNAKNDPNTGAAFKKIKIVEVVDMLNSDIRTTAQDTYIGRYPNSYDNKCVLVAAIDSYFKALEAEGILAVGKSSVDIDVDAQRTYLEGHSVDTSEMTDQEIKEANTGSTVLLAATVSILDAIEDITLNITI